MAQALVFDTTRLRDPSCVLYLPLYKLDGSQFMSRDAYGHLCTNYGATWTPHGRSFDGEDDYVDCGAPPALGFGTGDWMLECWAKATDLSHKVLMSKGTYNGADEFVFYIYSHLLRIASFGNYTTLVAPVYYDDNILHQFAGGRQGDDGVLFVDGQEVKRVSNFFAGREYTSSKKLSIGARDIDATPNMFFVGDIVLSMIFRRIVTPQEFSHRFLQMKEMFP